MKFPNFLDRRPRQKRAPLLIDLFCGLGGWTHGFLAEGWDVIGFDIEQHVYGEQRYPAQLVLQDVLSLHGSQFRTVDAIVASPPCTEYSYMAMPWTRAKQIARALRGTDDFPEGYTGSRNIVELNALFEACFRLQREACEAAGKHIPLIVENVKGCQPWTCRARWSYGSFFLWGDVPALMPATYRGYKSSGMNWSDQTKRGQDFTRLAGEFAIKNNGGSWFNIGSPGQKETGRNPVHELTGQKLAGNNAPRMRSERRAQRLQDGLRYDEDAFYCGSSGSKARKFASAMIAKIPSPLSRHIARTWYPREAPTT